MIRRDHPRTNALVGLSLLVPVVFLMHCAYGVDPERPPAASGGTGGASGATSGTGTAQGSSTSGSGGASTSSGSAGSSVSSSSSTSSSSGGAGGMGMPTCDDGSKNGDETGIDCGGGCAGCPSGQGCLTNADCLSQACAAGVCSPAMDCLQNIPGNCPNCATMNGSDKPKCQEYLKCYSDNACNPADACGSNDGVCGVNTIGGGNAPHDAAVETYTCACM